ncbi:DUF4397 domain-containing protein [Quadrisphaera sp. GCM10027208]|uniref:DUF4397 domain-containing protein n=1 Tax=Quadrisphaera sp. GCM10027208 TaxID=3273423 RepID=UPI0036226663
MRRTPAAVTLAAAPLALAGLALAAPASASTGEATVSVLHGVPGLTVDVYANGEVLLPDFAPGTLTDPLQLPAGEYDLAVYEAGADPDAADPAIQADDVAVPGGANVTVVAHLSADGTPVLTPFVNDVSTLAAGEGRLTVRHTAAAPAVDVRAGGEVVVPGLENPDEATLELPAGTVSADVVLAGTDTVAIGPADVDVAEGVATIVYAWGSAEENSLALAVQTIDGLHGAPSGIPSGEAGLADPAEPWLLVLGAGALAGAALAGRRLLPARASSRG